MAQHLCGLKDCFNSIGPGASDVTYESEGKDKIVRVCSYHTEMIMFAPRGTWKIEPGPILKPIPAKQHFI